MKRPGQFAIAAGFILLSLWVTWPLVLHLDEALPGDLGDPLLNTWILGWDADRLRHGLAGLWNAPIFFPYRNTLAFSEHLLGIGVPVAPIVWLTGRPFVAYNVAFVASFALAAIGMWRLARRLTGREDAAILAGAIFAFAPARLGQIGHLQVLMSGWMPLALLGLHRYFETGSRLALAAFTAVFIVQGLSNGYYLYFLAVPAVILAVHALATRPADRRRIAIGLAASALCIVVTFAPIALVFFDVRQTYGLQRTEDEVGTFGADLGAYLHGNEALRPAIRIWRALPHYDKPAGPEGEVFPGIAAIALAIAALWPRRQTPVSAVTRTPVVPLYAVIGAVALVLSMGADPTVWGVRLPSGGLSVALRVRAGLQRPSRPGTILDRRASCAGRACERRLCANGLGHAASRAYRRVRGCSQSSCSKARAAPCRWPFSRRTAVPIARRTRGSATGEPAPSSNCRQGSSTPRSGRINTNTRRCFTIVLLSTAPAATTRRSRYSWAAPRRRWSKRTIPGRIARAAAGRCGRRRRASAGVPGSVSRCVDHRALREELEAGTGGEPGGFGGRLSRSRRVSPGGVARRRACSRRCHQRQRAHDTGVSFVATSATPPIVWSARSTATSRRDGFRASGSPARNGLTLRSIAPATWRACGSSPPIGASEITRAN